MPRVPGKETLYLYIRTGLKRAIQHEAISQEISVSKFIEGCMDISMQNPPAIGKYENRGRKKKNGGNQNGKPEEPKL